MSRKDVFANLNLPGAPTAEGPAEVRAPKGRVRPILGSPELIQDASRSPVGAIGQSLSEVSERSRRAEEIERRLAEGLTVVSLDTEDIDPSFIPDRMLGAAEAHDRLVASIRDQGQQVPILVRPHPEMHGRFQVAFGHRRLRAIHELGLQINAVVRDLSDEQLVVAQGQENNERQDLTYIEKARFAQRLQQRFSRDVIMAALSVYKSDLSNMLSVVSRISDEVIDAIGPAPSVGRRSWLELADLLSNGKTLDRAIVFLRAAEIQALGSEERFKVLLAHLKPRPKKVKADVWSTRAGVRLAKVTHNDAKVEIVIDRAEAPEFASFVLDRLQSLFEEHRSKN
ncbi:plasmid partitioning protein RepB [Rhizobium leguminosarum]|uniref:plasmid partitioning protein RepB n=1 Tax=Rhizobium leguminosarum TaxID=384 RepID=UPI001C97730D|nr:plasmid partitioning protein RepB [Rhizobium leguminosarum]MBY5827393.1 plasmid partitioning protein RepB [Rhizobium leguminosarum]